MKRLAIRLLMLVLMGSVFYSLATPFAFAVATPKCHDSKPSDTPRIRKIYAKPDHVIVYHTAVAENNSYYFVAYGFGKGDQRFGGQFNYGASSGHWISHSVSSLTPNTTYFFEVRGGNGCRPGNWSEWVKATTPLVGSKIYNY